MRHHAIGFCETDGFFPAVAVGISNASITLSGVRTPCPHCGRSSEILSGEYEALADQLNFLAGENISNEALQRLRSIVERVQRDEISPEQAKEEAETVAPKAGRLFDVADWSDQAKATLYAAIVAAATTVGVSAFIFKGQATDPAAIEKIVDSMLNERIRSFETSLKIKSVPIPTPRPTRRP